MSVRYRKIAGSSSREYSALHVEVGRQHLQQAKSFLRKHFSKDTPAPYITGFPLHYVPDRSHIVNSNSRAGASILVNRQLSLLNNLVVRMNWSVNGLDKIDKTHGISLRTMLSRIQWEDKKGKQRQLFHSVDDTYKMDGVIFTWHPEFDDQASVVMTGLLAYLKTEYGSSVEKYFTPDCREMQSAQVWDKEKGGIVNEDDELLAEVTKGSLWWDIDPTNATKVIVDVSKVESNTAIVNQDDNSLPTVNTKSTISNGVAEVPLAPLAKAILTSTNPPNDSATVSSGLTLDTVTNRMDAMEGSVATVQSNMAEVHNTLNQTNMMVRQLVAHLNLNKDTTRSKGSSGGTS